MIFPTELCCMEGMFVKMDNVNLKKVNTKSESGFTFTDLAIAIFIIMLFTGTIGTIMYQITEVKLSTQLSAEATVFAIQILEDIDKTDYDLIQNGMENSYRTKFQIPSGFAIRIDVIDSAYTIAGQPTKRVELRIKYKFKGRDEELAITRYKVKEA